MKREGVRHYKRKSRDSDKREIGVKQQAKQNIGRLHSEGLALSSIGKHKEALACFDKIIKLNPKDNVAWHRKGIELNALNKYKDAIKCFDRAIVINRNDKYAWNHRGVSLRELEKYDEALRSCNEAIRIDDKYAFAWYTKGSILHHLGNATEAKTCFQRASKLAPGNDMYRKRVEGINELIGQSEVANKTSEQWHHDGLALSKLGRHEEAIACFDEAIRVNGMEHTAWHRKGIELNFLFRYRDAMECFERAIVINRNDQYAWNYRGEALRELGKYEEALASFNEAMITNENYPFAWYNKGTILQHLGDYTEAKACYERALQLAPNAPSWDGGAHNEKLYREALSEIEELEVVNNIKERIDQWEAEGYDVSEFKDKWFKNP